MAFKLLTAQPDAMYWNEGTAWLNLPMPPGLKEGVYVLDASTNSQGDTPGFSFVRPGNALFRVPLVNMTPGGPLLSQVSPPELAYVICGIELAGRLVRARNWTRWPDDILCVYVPQQDKLVMGLAALV